MSEPHSQDDVVELCRWVHLDPSKYRRFELPKPAVSVATYIESIASNSPKASSPVPIEPPVTAPPSLKPVEERGAPLLPPAGLANVQPLGQMGALRIPMSPRQEPDLSPVHRFSVRSDLTALATVHSRPIEGPQVLSIISAVGGCGATTILACLGRAFSILGERVLLVDSDGPTTLDCLYESRTTHDGIVQSFEPLSRFEGQVHLLRNTSDSPLKAQSRSARFLRAAAELRGRVDRILMAGFDSLNSTLARNIWSSGNCLVVLTPDLRSVVAVPSVLAALAAVPTNSGLGLRPWFVLNRFNKANSLHSAIRDELVRQLGSKLLPISIPESTLAEEAIAQGMTALDTAPHSPFAGACFDLAEWFQNGSEKFSSTMPQIEETQLVGE